MRRELYWMLAASVLGGLLGVYYMANLHPLNNFEFFVTLFALIGVAAGNLALLALYKVYKTYYAESETTISQTEAAAPNGTS